MRDLAISDEVRLLKVPEYDRDYRIVQDLVVSLMQSVSKFGHGLTLNLEVTDATQSHEAVGLDGHSGLVEFGAQIECDVEGIAGLDLVTLIAGLQLRPTDRH